VYLDTWSTDMRVELAYGRQGLTIEAPDDATVLLPQERPGLADEGASLLAALRSPIGAPPLREMIAPSDHVVIVFSDISRPMPNARVLPWLLSELAHLPKQNITLLNGLGTHRPNTAEELERMLGPSIVRQYTILQHDAWDEANLVDLGTTRYGHRMVVHREYYQARCKILTGFIEPHFFAGFSGGPKAVLPAIAGFQAIMDNHGYAMLNDPATTWGRTEGNPVWEEIREVAAATHPDFLLNVTLNRYRQITGVFAGDVWQAHAQGVVEAREAAMVAVDEPYDIVITTNSGYPLDINLYQAVKGMSCAAQIVKPGGSIIVAAECPEGVPDYGHYRRLVREAGSLQGIDDMIGQPGFRCQDQWEAQIQARVQQRAEVFVYSSYLSDEVLREMLLQPCHNIEATLALLRRKHGPQARICILPEGPQTIPYLA
jgi:nickel-dependent lactate racemase